MYERQMVKDKDDELRLGLNNKLKNIRLLLVTTGSTQQSGSNSKHLYCDPMQLSSKGQRGRQLGVSRANQIMANIQLAANTLSTSLNYSIPQIVSGQVSTRTSNVQKRNIDSTSYHGLPPMVAPKTQPSDLSSPRGKKCARVGSSSSKPSPKISIQVA
ncbi:hypothetical protein BY996DRAFT_6426596 [Phakopsora pachyrhizi]|nr:hypothetical protein BY996DRAFT_6426596 [Phakopsora pachyrhizi]